MSVSESIVKPGQLWKYKGVFSDLVSPYRNVRVVAYSTISDDSYVVESINYPSMSFSISHADFVNMWELDAVSEALEEFDDALVDLLDEDFKDD